MRSIVTLAVALLLVACRAKPNEDVSRAEPSAVVAAAAPKLDPAPAPSGPSPEPSAPAPAPASTERGTTRAAAQAETPRTNEAPRIPAAERDLAAPHASTTTVAASAAPPDEKPASVPARRGVAASGPSYETWLETTKSYRADASASLVVVLNAKAPFKCNMQYPYKLVLDAPPAGVTYPSSTVRGMRVEGKHASMPVPFTAESAGSYAVAGMLSFSTCTEDKCLVDKARVSVTVDVR